MLKVLLRLTRNVCVYHQPLKWYRASRGSLGDSWASCHCLRAADIPSQLSVLHELNGLSLDCIAKTTKTCEFVYADYWHFPAQAHTATSPELSVCHCSERCQLSSATFVGVWNNRQLNRNEIEYIIISIVIIIIYFENIAMTGKS